MIDDDFVLPESIMQKLEQPVGEHLKLIATDSCTVMLEHPSFHNEKGEYFGYELEQYDNVFLPFTNIWIAGRKSLRTLNPSGYKDWHHPNLIGKQAYLSSVEINDDNFNQYVENGFLASFDRLSKIYTMRNFLQYVFSKENNTIIGGYFYPPF